MAEAFLLLLWVLIVGAGLLIAGFIGLVIEYFKNTDRIGL